MGETYDISKNNAVVSIAGHPRHHSRQWREGKENTHDAWVSALIQVLNIDDAVNICYEAFEKWWSWKNIAMMRWGKTAWQGDADALETNEAHFGNSGW